MGAVYEARDTKHNTSCAIKEMSLASVPANERAQAIQNFLDEARILSSLHHPNLPALTDFFTEGTRHFLVMEFIDGKTLEELLEDNHGPFTERRVLVWARQLCDVLEYLHTQDPPIIFRDLKPGNIMLTRAGRIKLIDFGIARIFRPSSSQDTRLLGTPGFAPPEQYGSAQTDERSDIYSLAMTLFQLMADAVNDQGFGLKDIHTQYPQISAPVARVLEKATALKPEERYESVEVFRRALLGIGTFRFENGGEATTPDELAELCTQYREEASDYLFAGEIESWLQEIGEAELSRLARRLRQTVNDPDVALDRFLQEFHQSGFAKTTTASAGRSQPGAQRNGSVSPRRQEILVDPKKLDFGQVYPGRSAPLQLTIKGGKGELVSGEVRALESWIVLDQKTFDGTSASIGVRVDSTRLRGSTRYTGTITIAPDDSERQIEVTVMLEVLGYTTTQLVAQQGAGQTQAGQADDVVVPGTGRMRMAPQATVTVDEPLDMRRATEYRAKYGPPGGGGWEPLQNLTVRQSNRMQLVLTFMASFIMAGFFYLFLADLPPLAHTQVFLPPSPWFTVILLGLVPFATLGVAIANWFSHWDRKEAVSRVSTSLCYGLIVLGLSETIWYNLLPSDVPPLHLLVMVLLTALATTIGAIPRVSTATINGAIWGMQRVRWLMIVVATLLGGILGFALINGLASSCLTPFGVLLGMGVGAALILRVDRLMKRKPHP
jgi:hypothetical protein